MKKNTKTNSNRKAYADAEYNRLVSLYRDAGVDELKLKINDSWLHKIAELYGILEAIKDMPTIRYQKSEPIKSEETAAGKARVKYMAQYTASMTKLNKDLLGTSYDGGGNNDDLNEFEEE